MKTKNYSLTLLAAVTYVVMNGQTPNNKAHTIRKDLMSYKNQTTQQQSKTSNNSTSDIIEKKAAHLDSIATKIKAAAASRSAAEKALMLEEVSDIQKEAVIEKIKVIELSIKVKEEHYTLNNQTLTSLLSLSKKSIDVIDRAENYRIDASIIWQTAKKILAEASMEKENEAKLGMMNNAEEEEALALVKQTKAISLLNKFSTQVTFLPVTYVCVK